MTEMDTINTGGINTGGEKTILETIAGLYARQGALLFLGGPVSQTAHALQTAWLAEQAEAPTSLVAAALLHDIGHLIADGEHSHDGEAPLHAVTGADWLAPYFLPETVEPIRHHVESKRYFCSTSPDYLARLPAFSRLSLERQGGLMTPDEVVRFRANPWADLALRLRRWDDFAKVPDLPTPSLGHFLPILISAMLPGSKPDSAVQPDSAPPPEIAWLPPASETFPAPPPHQKPRPRGRKLVRGRRIPTTAESGSSSSSSPDTAPPDTSRPDDASTDPSRS